VENHEEYTRAITEICEQKIHYIFIDIEEELRNIEKNVDTESSKILMRWVQDAINRVYDNYKT